MSGRRVISFLILHCSLFVFHSSFLLCVLCASVVSSFILPAQEPPAPRLLIAFASFRERPKHPKVYFYEHDGVATGKVVGSIDPQNQRSDYHPALSHDGRFCAFASELENQTGRIQYWDRKEKKLVELSKLNDSPNAQ